MQIDHFEHEIIDDSFEIVNGRAVFADGSYGPVGWQPLGAARWPRAKASALVAVAVAASVALAGCSTTPATPAASHPTTSASASPKPTPVAPPVLTGAWQQSNSKSADSYQAATITGDTIEVDWISDGGSTKSLYWAGSFTAPTSAGAYTWTSSNDTTKTAGAMLASSDPTKVFSYADGVISYQVSALGTTTTVELKQK